MIPISDENPTLRTPVVTWILLGVIFAVWLVAQGGGMDGLALATTICNYGMVPGEVTGQASLGLAVPLDHRLGLVCVVDNESINVLTPVTSMFLHGGWGHVLGNALFFWVFGNNIEDSMGPGRFLLFYLICGLAAAGVHVLIDPASPIPTVGASGAVSGMLGAYLVLYPRVRVNMLFWFLFFIRVLPLPAWLVLLWWFGLQVITGLPELNPLRNDISGGVAVWAHVGGFVAGAVLVKVFESRARVQARVRATRAAHPLGWG